jgi:glycine/D-amino acid oxidase-like deaminating enzyme
VTRRGPDVAVVGGGIVGVATAAFLAEAGARVILYEMEGLAAGASGANSGVVQHPFDPVLVPLYDATVELYRALSGADAGFRLADEPAGLLLVSHRPAVVRRLAASLAASLPQLKPEVVEGPALRALEPSIATDVSACRVAIGYPVPPSASTYAYATLAERFGVTIRLGRRAIPVMLSGKVVGCRVDGRLEPAGVVVVAAGPWTSAVVDPSGSWRPIRPLWGVVVETRLAEAPRHVMEEAEMDEALGTGELVAGEVDGGAAVERAADERAALEDEAHVGAAAEGAAAEPGAPGGSSPGDPAPTPEFSLVTSAGASAVGSTFLAEEPDPAAWTVPILAHAASFVPMLETAPIRGVRSCARPLAEDGRPLIGPVPGVAGLYVCAGHGPWGISTGPGSARLVADAILGRGAAIPAAFDPGRFGLPPVG